MGSGLGTRTAHPIDCWLGGRWMRVAGTVRTKEKTPTRTSMDRGVGGCKTCWLLAPPKSQRLHRLQQLGFGGSLSCLSATLQDAPGIHPGPSLALPSPPSTASDLRVASSSAATASWCVAGASLPAIHRRISRGRARDGSAKEPGDWPPAPPWTPSLPIAGLPTAHCPDHQATLFAPRPRASWGPRSVVAERASQGASVIPANTRPHNAITTGAQRSTKSQHPLPSVQDRKEPDGKKI